MAVVAWYATALDAVWDVLTAYSPFTTLVLAGNRIVLVGDNTTEHPIKTSLNAADYPQVTVFVSNSDLNTKRTYSQDHRGITLAIEIVTGQDRFDVAAQVADAAEGAIESIRGNPNVTNIRSMTLMQNASFVLDRGEVTQRHGWVVTIPVFCNMFSTPAT